MSDLDEQKILLLNSTHSRFPLGSDKWVRATISALQSLDPGRHRLITSLGLPGWELTAWTAGQAGFRQILVLPGKNNAAGRNYLHRCLDEFALEPERTEAVFTGGGDNHRFRALRDRLVFELADMAAPVSVRPDGKLDGLLGEFRIAGGTVDERHRVEYSIDGWRPRYKLDSAGLNPSLEKLRGDWLYHWTHSHPGPWPDEYPAAFYSDLISKPQHYVRSAAATLARIAGERLIRGSSFHKAGGEMMVSLTSLAPADAVPLMRWRSRYRRWSLEPYGVALRKRALLNLGARQVRYFDSLPPGLPECDRPFTQLRGKFTDWSSECEWRVPGNIHLEVIDPADIVFLTYDSGQFPAEEQITPAHEILSLVAE